MLSLALCYWSPFFMNKQTVLRMMTILFVQVICQISNTQIEFIINDSTTWYQSHFIGALLFPSCPYLAPILSPSFPYLVLILSLSCPYLVPILSLSCLYLVPILSFTCYPSPLNPGARSWSLGSCFFHFELFLGICANHIWSLSLSDTDIHQWCLWVMRSLEEEYLLISHSRFSPQELLPH